MERYNEFEHYIRAAEPNSKERAELKNRHLHVKWNSAKPQNEVSETRISFKENEVLDVMSENPRVSIKEIAKITGVSNSTIDRIIKQLKIKGVIERQGPKNNSEWVIKI